MMGQVSEVKMTTVVSRYDILTICTPPAPTHWVGPGGIKMMNMAHLLTMMVELTSETWYELINDASGDRVVLFRPGVHADLE